MLKNYFDEKQDGRTKVVVSVEDCEISELAFYLDYKFDIQKHYIDDEIRFKRTLAYVVKQYKTVSKNKLITINLSFFDIHTSINGKIKEKNSGNLRFTYMADDVPLKYDILNKKVIDYDIAKKMLYEHLL